MKEFLAVCAFAASILLLITVIAFALLPSKDEIERRVILAQKHCAEGTATACEALYRYDRSGRI